MLSEQRRPYKYIIYFASAFIACYLTEDVLLNRFISFGHGYYVTGGTFIYFTSPLILDVVAEVYGYKVARQMLWSGLCAMLFMAISMEVVLKMPYPVFWTSMIDAYSTVLTSIVKVALVSVFSIFVGQLINAFLISKWKILTRGRYFWLRSVGSSVIGDSFTVISSVLLIFFGKISLDLLLYSIVPLWIAMVCFTALGAIPATFLAKFVARKEGLNHYDIGVNFNPFKLSEDVKSK
jgi:uncharacterized integral membrane protein (TIGR00697 family)